MMRGFNTYQRIFSSFFCSFDSLDVTSILVRYILITRVVILYRIVNIYRNLKRIYLDAFTLKMNSTKSFETSVNIYSKTQLTSRKN